MRILLHKYHTAIVLAAGLGIAASGMAATLQPDTFTACRDGSLTDLSNAIEAHNENAWKLNRKFKDIWYPQGPAPEEVRKKVTLEHVYDYLAALRPRRAAVLFHAAGAGRLCTWLLRPDRDPVSGVVTDTPGTADALRPRSWHLLGLRGAGKLRMATPIGADRPLGTLANADEWDEVLKRVSRVLIPDPIAQVLVAETIDTLVVVPITVRAFDPSADLDQPAPTGSARPLRPESRLALSVSVVPFSALRIGNASLVERMSVVISPGFHVFAQDPTPAPKQFSHPIVIGDPRHHRFQPLDGARGEAKAVADLLKTDEPLLLIGEQATKARLEHFLQRNASSVDFIHLATHGVADGINPVDESYLVFSDDLWNARSIAALRRPMTAPQGGSSDSSLPLLERHPLVVMSACQTALGKDFPAGTIGLARAWQWAGAGNVVMSLWSVDDLVTQELMTLFVKQLTAGKSADKALQAAMLAVRKDHPSPTHWASFSVYGAPQLSR